MEWIPIKTRELTKDEKDYYTTAEYMFDCKLPNYGEEVLITTRYGDVVITTFYDDDDFGSYFEQYEDSEDVVAWMPLPMPYKESK